VKNRFWLSSGAPKRTVLELFFRNFWQPCHILGSRPILLQCPFDLGGAELVHLASLPGNRVAHSNVLDSGGSFPKRLRREDMKAAFTNACLGIAALILAHAGPQKRQQTLT
jgi:hypothetical protein